jgi:hypothetical protein
VIKINKMLVAVGMFYNHRFVEVIMKGINYMFFKTSLGGAISLASASFNIRTRNLINNMTIERGFVITFFATSYA